MRSLPSTQEVIRLSASIFDEKKDLLRLNASVSGLGTFGVAVAGARTTKLQIRLNKEFIRKPEFTSVSGSRDVPQEVERSIVLPQDTQGDVETVEAIER